MPLSSKNPIGLIYCQGGMELFQKQFCRLELPYRFIKNIKDFEDLGGLILHGGESTVQSLLFEKKGYHTYLANVFDFKTIPVLGVCAGCILLSTYDSEKVKGLQVLDIQVTRNFYGTQRHSGLKQSDQGHDLLFIRAPRITSIGSDIEILETYQKHPVLIKKGLTYAATFHPEALDSDFSRDVFHAIFSK